MDHTATPWVRRLLAAVSLSCAVGLFGSPAWAQAAGPAAGAPAGFVAPAEPRADETNAQRATSQPGNNAPFWRGVRDSGQQAGSVSFPMAEGGVLVQSFVQYPGSQLTTAGEAWRQVRNRVIIPWGGAILVLAVLSVAFFYGARGTLGGHEKDTGRVVERFTPVERAAHWANAVAFVLLAISGIVLAFGKFFLLPALGKDAFGALTLGLKNIHNFVGPLFAISLVIVIVTFVRDNLPRAEDWTWLRRAGGMFGGEEVPSHRFNAGEKVLFWAGVFFFGLIVVGSGIYLDKIFPQFDYLRSDMQVAHMIHAAAAVLMMALFVGHIYMGTVGMKGAYGAMRHGYVDEAWAKEHHALWYEDIRAGRIPAQRSATEAPGVRATP